MVARSKFRGHGIENIDGEWFFTDSKKPVKENKGIPCGHCGKEDTKEGHDGCVGVLSGVMNACCGHGQRDEAYVQFLNGNIVRGNSAVIIMKLEVY